MDFLIVLQFLVMLLISAVNADPCLSVEVITHKLAGCYQSGGVTKHTVIPLNACTPIANFASVDVSLKTNCVPPGYTCNLVVFNSNTCSPANASVILSPVTALTYGCTSLPCLQVGQSVIFACFNFQRNQFLQLPPNCSNTCPAG